MIEGFSSGYTFVPMLCDLDRQMNEQMVENWYYILLPPTQTSDILLTETMEHNNQPTPSSLALLCADKKTPFFCAPGSEDRGHIVLGLSVCLSTCL